jgi:hypothetical protein
MSNSKGSLFLSIMWFDSFLFFSSEMNLIKLPTPSPVTELTKKMGQIFCPEG